VRYFGTVLSVFAFIAALASGAHAAIYRYSAVTKAPALISGTVTAAGISWDCSGSRCTTSGPWPTPGVAACQALTKQVGSLYSYGHKERLLSPAELQQCNAAAGAPKIAIAKATVPRSLPAVRASALPPGTIGNIAASHQPLPVHQGSGGSPPATAFAPATLRTAPPVAAGNRSPARTEPIFTPVTIRTVALLVTGTGFMTGAATNFTPVTLRTAPITVTGTGFMSGAATNFTPVTLRTAPLTVTGTGSLAR